MKRKRSLNAYPHRNQPGKVPSLGTAQRPVRNDEHAYPQPAGSLIEPGREPDLGVAESERTLRDALMTCYNA